MQNVTEKDKPINTLRKLIKEEDIIMLVTKSKQGQLRSRPMEVSHVTDEGKFVFFTHSNADLSTEITENNAVNISFCREEQDDYVSVSGVAQINQNQSEIEALWQDRFTRWIPDGLDEPTLAMIVVTPLHAEHWGMKDHRTSLGKLLDLGSEEAVYETMSK
ncbi:MAG TPA: pyridoxamine 5'-phosphate oxidase family protein [Marinagarivorans sp.]